ncbi:MAG: mannosyl-3-phosphoglycerate phosphatase [Candidatus Aminicenantes bacterium]
MAGTYSQKGSLFLIFTDLDGTLLDHDTYSFEPALPALKALKEKNIPLIICTSKTRAEIEKWRLELHNDHPFIAENGGAIYIPKGYFPHTFCFEREKNNYLAIELGTPYAQLRDILNRIRNSLQLELKGFGDLSPEEVARLCGFSPEDAKLAKKREYDEPFLLEEESAINKIQKMASLSNLQVTRGGRFFHLMGENDKGEALRLLTDMYRKKTEHIETLALGDSLSDLPMLRAADHPVLVQKPEGSYDPEVKLPNLYLAPGIGPAGWNESVLKLLNSLL